MVVEGPWLGDSFGDYLRRIPREYLQNQLYMFSERFDIDEAADRIHGLDHWFTTETFDAGIEGLNRKTGLNLRPIHVRATERPESLEPSDLGRLRDALAPEYELLARLRQADPAQFC